MMFSKKRIFFNNTKKEPKLKVYLLSLSLAIWGIANIIYWEIYKGYSACWICKWHRAVYITLFISLLALFKYKKFFIKLLIWLLLVLEMLVSIMQVLKFCSPTLCRKVPLSDKINLSLVVITLGVIFFFELRTYLKHKNYLNLQIKQVDRYLNFSLDRR